MEDLGQVLVEVGLYHDKVEAKRYFKKIHENNRETEHDLITFDSFINTFLKGLLKQTILKISKSCMEKHFNLTNLGDALNHLKR